MSQNSHDDEQTDSSEYQPLFRKEVLQEQQNQWQGKVLLTPSLSHTLFSAFAILTGTAVILLLVFGQYTRKERISGWLVPQQGLVHIQTPEAGIITQLNVKEGTQVVSGEALLVISTELQSQALGATQHEIVRRLERRRESLLSEKELNSRLFEQELMALDSQLEQAKQEVQQLEQELDTQRQRLTLAQSTSARLSTHRTSGAVSEEQWLDSEDRRLGHEMSVREIERDLTTASREILTLQASLKKMPFDLRKSNAGLDREVDALEQELAEAESRRQFVLAAPENGIVSTLQLEPGNSVQPGKPLLSILPLGSELEARLYVPTRAIGFIEPGQAVLLRYQSFPYQKFGHYKGTISSVSRSTVKRSDTAQIASGLNSDGFDEPVYPITVVLDSQTINAYGKPVPLQPGMEFEADILIESRRLYEWILEPLFTLTGKMNA